MPTPFCSSLAALAMVICMISHARVQAPLSTSQYGLVESIHRRCGTIYRYILFGDSCGLVNRGSLLAEAIEDPSLLHLCNMAQDCCC